MKARKYKLKDLKYNIWHNPVNVMAENSTSFDDMFGSVVSHQVMRIVEYGIRHRMDSIEKTGDIIGEYLKDNHVISKH